MQLTENNARLHMYIAGEEVVCNKEINIVEQLKNTNTIVLNNCYPLSWEDNKDYVSRFYMPKDYSLFKLAYIDMDIELLTEDEIPILTEDNQIILIKSENVDQEIMFAGIVKRSKSMDLNPSMPHYGTFQVLDFKTFLSEGELFNFVLTDTTIGDAIEYVISQYSQYNFTVGNINLGNKVNETIGSYNCNQKTLFDVLEYFAQITNSVWTVRYISDTEMAIDFYLMDNLPQGQDLVYDKEYCDINSIVNISYSFNSNDYRNKQIMTSENISSNNIITQQYITISQEYKTDENISSILTAKLNNTNLTVATTQDKENGETADLYYTVGENKFELDEEVLPGQNLVIEYYAQIPGRQVVLNKDEISRIDTQLDNSGIITRYENRQDADTSQELNAIGQNYIQFKGKPQITLNVTTINNDIYNVGDKVFFNANNTEGLADLVDTYAVKKKEIKIIHDNTSETNNIFYKYELSNNFDFESAVNFFDNQRAKIIGNIKEGEYINRYVENYKNYNIIFNPPTITGGV